LQVGPDIAVQTLLAVLVLSLVVREDTGLHPVRRWRPLAFVGTISYGIYLMHMLAANLVRPVIGHQRGIAVFAATIPVVLVVAYVSFRWFETPIRALAHRDPATRR
jgi:peptidoglycan/LPS O-acetylase OafA/YrhL